MTLGTEPSLGSQGLARGQQTNAKHPCWADGSRPSEQRLHRLIFLEVLREGYLSTFRASSLPSVQCLGKLKPEFQSPLQEKQKQGNPKSYQFLSLGPMISLVGVEEQSSNFLKEAQTPGQDGTYQTIAWFSAVV